MSAELKRTEFVFIYDIADANPNGDPNDENRPRLDAETGRVKVTDVRLKRTVRDYLRDFRDKDIFCRQIEKDDGTIYEGKDRADDFYREIEREGKKAKNVVEKARLIEKSVIEKCIDVRLFGATIPVSIGEKGSSVTLTGPVQVAMGTTLHRVEPRFIKGTGAFASGQGKQQKTFREEYVVPYALIAFYGIVNQQAAKSTGMTVEDAEALYEGIWYGTKNLITRSKIGQRPLLLLLVEYNEPNAYIGRLDRFLEIRTKRAGQRDEEIRDAAELILDTTKLVEALKAREGGISRIRCAHDARLEAKRLGVQEPMGEKDKWSADLKVEDLNFL